MAIILSRRGCDGGPGCDNVRGIRRAILILLLVAAALRLPMLDVRPMHADEAILADKLGTFVASGHYPYDPREYHGPVLGYLGWLPAKLLGTSEVTLRIAPAVCGILLSLAPLLFAPVIGAGAAIAAAAMVAVSPALVYYSRYYIPEMALALWTALLLVSVLRGWWLAAGLAAALMIATKETAVLALAAMAVAYFAVYRPRRVPWWLVVGLLWISVVLALPWRWGLLAESVAAYLERSRGGAHAHPWYQYLRWLAITEAPLLVAGILALWQKPKPAVRFLSLYALILLAIYSAIPYKTPWCSVSPLFALTLAGGSTVASLRPRWWVPLAALLALAAALASTRYSADPRNPWVYAQTGRGVYTIRDRIAAFPPEIAIDVYTRENWWPLPWYLRQHTNIRWWRDVSPTGSAAPIVLVDPSLEPDLVRKLYEGPPAGERELYMNLFEDRVELRPGVEVHGYVAKSLWDRGR